MPSDDARDDAADFNDERAGVDEDLPPGALEEEDLPPGGFEDEDLPPGAYDEEDPPGAYDDEPPPDDEELPPEDHGDLRWDPATGTWR
jgi:hypothetical protein